MQGGAGDDKSDRISGDDAESDQQSHIKKGFFARMLGR